MSYKMKSNPGPETKDKTSEQPRPTPVLDTFGFIYPVTSYLKSLILVKFFTPEPVTLKLPSLVDAFLIFREKPSSSHTYSTPHPHDHKQSPHRMS